MKKLLGLFVTIAILVGLLVPLTASAQGPLTYGSAFQVQNLENAVAAITVTFYNQDGSTVDAATFNDTIAALGSKNYFAVNVAGLPSTFAGSAVISSDRRLRAIHNLYANNYAFGASSAGYTEGAAEVNLPLIMRNNSGYNTWFAVQNAGTGDAVVGVVFKKGSVGNDFTHPDVTIKPGAARLFYQADMADLGDKFVGSAKVTSKNAVPVVATVVEVGPTTLFAYDGFVAGSTAFVAPLFQYNNSGYVSSINVQNIGTAATDVTIEYIPTTGNGTACTETKTVGAGAGVVFGLFGFARAEAGCDCFANNGTRRFIGSARVSVNSASQPLVAVVNQLNGAANKASAYSAFRPEDASASISVPLVMDRNSNYWTSLTVYNAGTAATTVNVDYSGAAPDEAPFELLPGAGKVITHWNRLGDRYVGSASVTGGAGSKLIAIINEVNTTAAGDSLYTYNGFNY